MLIFDLETDGLLPELTCIHCIGIWDSKNNSYTIYDPARDTPSVKEALVKLREADCICGHNIIGFDIKAIQKLIPGWEPKGDVLDTLVWARVANTTIREGDFARLKTGEITSKLMGSHSLKAYGRRMGILKGDYGEQENAWTEWSPEMSSYCLQDVKVTVALWKRLQYREVPEECLQLEHEVARIIDRQIDHGWLFDVHKAELLYSKLLARRTELIDEIREVCPPYTKKLPDFVPKRDNKKLGYKKGVPVPRTKTQDFNPGSSMHVADFFITKYGWEPTEYTPNSKQPTIDDEILAKLEYPEAKLIGEYLMVNKRISQLAEGKQAWLKRVEEDDRIHGFVNPNGAVTGRMTHSKPNVAQVPANDAPYGPECRELFIVPKGRKLVGCDAAGLELRMLAHYMFPYDNGEYAQAVLHGRKEDGTDAHSMNAEALGKTRGEGKTWFYGLNMAHIKSI